MKTPLSILVLLALTAFLLGCAPNKEPSPTSFEVATQDAQTGQVQWIDANEIHQGPIQRDALTDEQMERIKALQKIFVEIDGQTVDQWADSFKRDLNPDSELAIWERMAKAYSTYCESRDLSMDAKKEVYKVVLLRSMASPEEVLKRIELSAISLSDAESVMSGF